jgi:hypothetical protein
MSNTGLFPESKGAIFSPCLRYRYSLWRIWNPELPVCMFLMLNPSTADDQENDSTVERCQRRAVQMGYGGLRVANLFAWRSTDRSVLAGLEDPVGPNNDAAILQAARSSAIVICAWGADGKLLQRDRIVVDYLHRNGFSLHALSINLDGSPKHPLYVSYSDMPFPYLNDINCQQILTPETTRVGS